MYVTSESIILKDAQTRLLHVVTVASVRLMYVGMLYTIWQNMFEVALQRFCATSRQTFSIIIIFIHLSTFGSDF